MPPVRKTSFVVALGYNVRRRHEHSRIGNLVSSFLVQIEIYIHGRWEPVVRYDTAHGFAHRDLMKFGGKVDKTPLFHQNYNEALDFAEADLRANWKSYVEQFLKEGQE